MGSRRGLLLNMLAIFFSSAACNHRVKFNFLWSITGSLTGDSVVATLTKVQAEQPEVHIPAGAKVILCFTTTQPAPGLFTHRGKSVGA